MKEIIIDLLDANCKVKMGFEDSMGDYREVIIVDHHINSDDLLLRVSKEGWFPERLCHHWKIVEVIPPFYTQYKIWDKVMWFNKEKSKRIGPETIIGKNEYGIGLEGLVGYFQPESIAPYHEGVNYNPLPTNKE